MRRSKEIVVLLVLLVGVMAFVLWYVRERRAERHAQPAAERTLGPVVTTAPAARSTSNSTTPRRSTFPAAGPS
ncbi:hypothetical protein [Oleiharenicola sp. Vm1]|uniref:hypothetical protein n=1 Tax=Oleiharenicola sp. Vm1 TaxID=3398393 RepID=UPI0039F5186B